MPGDLDKKDIISLLSLDNDSDIEMLLKTASKLKIENFGEKFLNYGILTFSNFCEENCNFCGLREDNFSIERYRLNPEEILQGAKSISNLGIKEIILESGLDTFYDTDVISYLIYSLKQSFDFKITLSLGERGFDEYRSWKFTGADNYLLRLVTSNENLFANYHTSGSLEKRVRHLEYLKRQGYKLITGTFIGTPGQSIEDIANDLLTLKTLKPGTINLIPFIPAPFTPFQNKKGIDVKLLIKSIAAARLIMPGTNIIIPPQFDFLGTDDINLGVNSCGNVITTNFSIKSFTTEIPYRSIKSENGLLKNRTKLISKINHDVFSSAILKSNENKFQ
ncbi:MAG: radical SAM protein [Melioribacteraceae bacterium]|nr:radical SAM protein [Melioribacteraceae bacterium]